MPLIKKRAPHNNKAKLIDVLVDIFIKNNTKSTSTLTNVPLRKGQVRRVGLRERREGTVPFVGPV